MTPLIAPKYTGNSPSGLGLAVESMKRNTTDEGWQIFNGLWKNGYELAGYNLDTRSYRKDQLFKHQTHIPTIIDIVNPGIVIVQDKREWEGKTSGGKDFDQREKFVDVDYLSKRDDIFKLTIVKDAQHNSDYHRESAEEIGCNGWIVYYDVDKVCSLAPYIRKEHVVRTYHTIDKDIIPDFSKYSRVGCLLSGALSTTYPIRQQLFRHVSYLENTDIIRHPGYHRTFCHTPEFLDTLSRYKVAICTSSIYGYALRKMIEATACGCVVLTNLPDTDILPEIDDNLIRIKPHPEKEFLTLQRYANKIREAISKYNPERQRHFAENAKQYYDYRVMCGKLVRDVEQMRVSYNNSYTFEYNHT